MEAKKYIEHFDSLKNDRKTWDRQYQILGEYVSQIKQNFDTAPQAGEFLLDDIYDATGAFAAHNAASSLLGMLWPGSAKQSIEITPPDDIEGDSTELTEFYGYMTDMTVRAMDNPKANLNLALDEYMIDQLIFGTSGVGVERGYESDVLFKSYGVKEMYVDEGKNGRVADIFLCFEWTVRRLMEEYPVDRLSEKTQEKIKNGKLNDRVKVLICILPRKEFKAEKGVLAMPYMSMHFEYDSKHLIKESGFTDLPIKVARFRKLNYERYGRSPAMMALPDIREANALREAVIVATEKNLDPPMAILDDGMLGGGTVDTSAGALNVFNVSAAMGNRNPIFPLVTVGSIPDALARLEELKNTISQHFFLDRLLDFNNETQMTFGEAQIRNQIRNASLSSLFSRQIAELFTPLIQRVVDILFEDGKFGVIKGSEQEAEFKAQGKEIRYIPQELVERIENDQSIYEINYKTQASKASRAEEYIAILDVLSFSIQAMQVDPSVRHRVDLHKGVQEIGNIRALPVGILKQDDEVKKLMDAEAQQANAQNELNSGQQLAGIVESMASANKAVRE